MGQAIVKRAMQAFLDGMFAFCSQIVLVWQSAAAGSDLHPEQLMQSMYMSLF